MRIATNYILPLVGISEIFLKIYTNHDPKNPKSPKVKNFTYLSIYISLIYRHDSLDNSAQISSKQTHKTKRQKISVRFVNEQNETTGIEMRRGFVKTEKNITS